MDTVAFLRLILPDDGLYCATIQTNNRHRNFFFQTIEELAAFVLQQDALANTAYHACATFKTANSRKQENVHLIKSLWSDVDVGPDKPYKTRAEASEALTDFIAQASLPPLLKVHSGAAGMHTYLVLETALTPERWRPYAIAYRELAQRYGFHIDVMRAADCSSVLRPPGTHNRKLGLVHPVTVAEAAPPAWIGDLPFVPSFKEQAKQSRSFKGRLFEGSSVYADAPSDPYKVAASCAQIGNLRDMKGNIPYHPWLFSIWTLHHCTDGDDVAHDFSEGHPKYSFEETQRKLDEDKGPITCVKFHEYNSELCEACEYWQKISTPLQLGRDPAGWAFSSAPRKEQFEQSTAQSPPPGMNGADVKSCFVNTDRGLVFQTEDKKGQPDEILISRQPIRLHAYCRAERNPDHSLIFTLSTAKEGEQLLSIPASTFFSSQGMPELARLGATIHNTDLMRMYVREQIDHYNEESAPQTRFDQFGWKGNDDAFLCGTRLYSATEVTIVTGSPEIERRARMLGPRGGSLAAWSSAANQLFAVGCEPHSFALCCAFGAVLMHFHSEEGGTIVNLVSEQSATGKTTGLEAVASVWGELDGVRLTDEDTKVSRGLLLGTLGNLPCVFDELHRRDPEAIRQFVIMFTNGRDKLRGRSDGTLREPSGDWQTILVLGSNMSITDILQAKNTEEAQAYRIMEFQAEQNFSSNDGDKLRRELKINAGWAGDAFLRYLLAPGVLPAVKRDLENVMHELWDEVYHFDKRHRFWVRGIACALVAGRIVKKLGILNFDPIRIAKWAIEQCQGRVHGEFRRDYADVLNEALYELWSMTMVVDCAWSGPKTACNVLSSPSPKGFYARRERETGRMYVARTWLRQWLTEHMINRTAFTKTLQQERIIRNVSKFVTLGAGTSQNLGGQIMCYEIDMHHPRMTSALEVSERDVDPQVRREKPINVLEFRKPPPATAFPPLPSSSGSDEA